MYLRRSIDTRLAEWARPDTRKPLLLRGARQVGKTESVRALGQSFPEYVEVNFEADPAIHALFGRSLRPNSLLENLSGYLGQSIKSENTLLFFDEIQACPNAIRSLRFFYEDMPQLHVIAAGSLLEFAMAELPSFGVGRIRSMFMYPMSFDEFLMSAGEDLLLSLKRKSSPSHPLQDPIHAKLSELLIKFSFIGGMPEVVSTYIESRDLNACAQILDDLIRTLEDDFAKYRKRIPPTRLSQVFHSIARQSGGKFIYSKVAQDLSHHQIKQAVQLLTMAGLVIPVTHTSANGIPLGAEANEKYQKMLLLDTGIAQKILRLNIGDALTTPTLDVINKGSLAEQLVGLELIKYDRPFDPGTLFYWRREAKSGNAEVDYVIADNIDIIPVEVKSGGRGSMQSMRVFLELKKSPYGIRIALENFSEYNNTRVFPLYAISNITE